MNGYLVVIEKAKRNYAAYCPDLPGCIATGKTRQQVEKNMNAAIRMHLNGMREDRRRVPSGKSYAYVVVPTT